MKTTGMATFPFLLKQVEGQPEQNGEPRRQKRSGGGIEEVRSYRSHSSIRARSSVDSSRYLTITGV